MGLGGRASARVSLDRGRVHCHRCSRLDAHLAGRDHCQRRHRRVVRDRGWEGIWVSSSQGRLPKDHLSGIGSDRCAGDQRTRRYCGALRIGGRQSAWIHLALPTLTRLLVETRWLRPNKGVNRSRRSGFPMVPPVFGGGPVTPALCP